MQLFPQPSLEQSVVMGNFQARQKSPGPMRVLTKVGKSTERRCLPRLPLGSRSTSNDCLQRCKDLVWLRRKGWLRKGSWLHVSGWRGSVQWERLPRFVGGWRVPGGLARANLLMKAAASWLYLPLTSFAGTKRQRWLLTSSGQILSLTLRPSCRAVSLQNGFCVSPMRNEFMIPTVCRTSGIAGPRTSPSWYTFNRSVWREVRHIPSNLHSCVQTATNIFFASPHGFLPR